MSIPDDRMGDDDRTFQRAPRSQMTRGRELLVVSEQGGRRYELPTAGCLSIGRAATCDLALEDPSVSRRHAVLEVGREVRIRDVGSANGVYVAGRRLRVGERADISPGDVIEIGGARLVLHVRPAEAVRGEREEERPIVVDDPAMRKLHELVDTFGSSSISILILGETGVGKDILAERIHRRSPRHRGPFLRLNCAAISPTLLESELFGHERGAFTGAATAKPGLFESAHRGTVFLDEIGELPAEMQAKLLRVIEDREVRRVGSLQSHSVDIRFIAATNRDPRGEIARGAFREDLYFRLGGVTLEIPPLRARRTEIVPLARLFAARVREPHGPEVSFATECASLLETYAWPGNVRELRNVIERAVLLATDGVVRPEHLPSQFAAPVDADATTRVMTTLRPARRGTALKTEMAELERARMIEALERCGGNQTRAAASIGMPRRTFVLRLREYGIACKVWGRCST